MVFKSLAFSGLNHDGAGSALVEGVFAAPAQLHKGGKARFWDPVDTLDRMLNQRSIAGQEPGSSNQDLPSLGYSFASVVSELGLSSAVGFRVVVEGPQRAMTALLRDEVYRIGREAIINAFRHSGANEIVTEIEYRAAELRIAVRDNGCGIDADGLWWKRNSRRGIQGMRERAERIGARLRILSRVSLGTEVELCVPGAKPVC